MKCIVIPRVAEVAREHGWHPPKSLDSDENFKPEHTLFCRKLRFVAIYALFGDLWSKKVFHGQEVHYYMVHIAYFNELNLRICDYAQKRRICRKFVNTRLTIIFMASFAPDEKLPSSATLVSTAALAMVYFFQAWVSWVVVSDLLSNAVSTHTPGLHCGANTW